MKVLILADGTSVHSRRALAWHLKQGCEVVFADSHDPKPEGTERYRFLRYSLGLKGARYLRKVIGPRLTSRLVLQVTAQRLRRIFQRVRPDVVHLYQIDQRAYHCLLAGLKPLVLSSWGTDINQHFMPLADPEYRRQTAEALAAADVVLADSSDILEKCSRLTEAALSTEVLPLGIDTNLFRPGYEEAAQRWREELAIPADARVLFSIRALTPLYGHHQILEAFHQAHPRFRSRTVLVFKAYNNKAASDYENQLRRLGEQLGVASCLRWSRSVPFEQMPVLYAAADTIVNYPSMDAAPVTFLEAAACERLVITNRLPAYAGTLAEQYFRMVEPGDVAALADALVEVVNDPGSTCRARLAEARALVKSTYNEIGTANRLMEIYRRLAS